MFKENIRYQIYFRCMNNSKFQILELVPIDYESGGQLSSSSFINAYIFEILFTPYCLIDCILKSVIFTRVLPLTLYLKGVFTNIGPGRRGWAGVGTVFCHLCHISCNIKKLDQVLHLIKQSTSCHQSDLTKTDSTQFW